MIANDIYAKKSGKTTEEIKQIMDAETYFTAEEALAAGFVDEILKNEKQLSAQMSGDKLIWGGVDVTQFKDKLNLAKLTPQPQQVLASQQQLAQKPIINNLSGGQSMPTTQVDNQPPQAAANLQLDLSLSDLKSKYPAVYQAAVDEERERIQAIDELAEAGHEDLIKQAKYETFMSAGDFAIALAKANKTKILQRQQSYTDEVKASGVNDVTGIGITNAHAGIEQPNAKTPDKTEVELFQSIAHLVK
jgi:enoyl-CoA hydratase/carnithine racemase